MKKLFKTLLITFMAVCAACMCAFALTACSKGDDKGDDEDTSATYTFVIKNSDGSAYTRENAKTQICEVDDGLCYPLTQDGIYPENGTLTLTQAQVNKAFGSETDVTEFLFHVIPSSSEDYGDPNEQGHCVFKVNGPGTYTCKMYKAATT